MAVSDMHGTDMLGSAPRAHPCRRDKQRTSASAPEHFTGEIRAFEPGFRHADDCDAFAKCLVQMRSEARRISIPQPAYFNYQRLAITVHFEKRGARISSAPRCNYSLKEVVP